MKTFLGFLPLQVGAVLLVSINIVSYKNMLYNILNDNMKLIL